MKTLFFFSVAIAAAIFAIFSEPASAASALLLAQGAGAVDLTKLQSQITEFFNSVKDAHSKLGERVNQLSAQVVELAQARGTQPIAGTTSIGAEVRAALDKHSEQITAMSRQELRGQFRMVLPHTMMNSTILSPVAPGESALQHPDKASGIVGPAMRRMTVRALLPSLGTDAGATSYTRMSSFTNNAQAQGAGSSPLERDGQVIGESGMAFELVTVPVVTVAHWIPASSQVLNDVAALEQHIRTWLSYGLSLEEEDELLNGAGGSANLEGLVTVAQAYNRGATSDTRADTLRKAITQLLLADHVCSGIVVNPADEEALDLLKDANGQYLRVKVGGQAWNVPVIATNSMAQGSWLAGDFSSALLRPRQGITIEVSNSHSDFFVRNLIAIRAELREALEIHRPNGFVTGSFA